MGVDIREMGWKRWLGAGDVQEIWCFRRTHRYLQGISGNQGVGDPGNLERVEILSIGIHRIGIWKDGKLQ
jgi:hypothetical protein